jgi:serine/threonine protein kinase/formylglycine-generating enzyme required for sulfatase activity
MIPATPEHSLLFGLLALHAGLIRGNDLLEALNAWSKDKSRPLDVILGDRSALPSEEAALVGSLVEALLRRHENDAERSLAALLPPGALPPELNALEDAELRNWLARVGRGPSALTECEALTTPTFHAGQKPNTSTAVTGPGDSGRMLKVRQDASQRYRILRRHARGGLGEVFLAHDEELQREVALKEMQVQHLDRADTRARFLREGEITGRLEHPGVVPVYGLGTYPDGRPFYVMRFIRGESLTEAIQCFHSAIHRTLGERTLELRKLLTRFVDVCNAIAYAHSHGVLHRDLKPDNIMLGEFGETLVVDWGLAKQIHQSKSEIRNQKSEIRIEVEAHNESRRQAEAGKVDSDFGFRISDLPGAGSQLGQVIGTPPYMSPEQAAGRVDQLGPASDVYSLGATLYALLTGQKAFPSDLDTLKVLRLVQSGSFPAPREINRYVPRPLEAVCLKAMALQPEQRYGSAKELAGDVERWLADEPVSAYAEAVIARLARWARRHRTAVTSGAVLCITALIALSVSYVMLAQEQKRTEAANQNQALAQVEALLEATPGAVPDLLKGLDRVRERVRPRLVEIRKQPPPRTPSEAELRRYRQRQTRASLALLDEDPDEVEFLRERILAVDLDPEECLVLRDYLAPFSARLVPGLWQVVERQKSSPEQRFRALVALAHFDPKDPRWEGCSEHIIGPLLSADPLHVGIWTRALLPVSEHLIGPLSETFSDPVLPAERRVAATVMREYVRERPDLLIHLLGDANEAQMALLLPRVQEKKDAVLPLLRNAVRKMEPTHMDKEESRDTQAHRQANLAVLLLHLGDNNQVWPLLCRSAHPDTRTYLIHLLAPCEIDPSVLIRRLEREQDNGIRQGLILALGSYSAEQLPQSVREGILPRLLEWYRNQPDPGVHGAIDWLLRASPVEGAPRKLDWNQGEKIGQIDGDLKGQPFGQRHWYVASHGQTLVLLGPDEFLMGSPTGEAGHQNDETLHPCRIGRRFAIGSKEVTVELFKQFLDSNRQVKHRLASEYSPEKECPEINVTWYEAAQFCRWLSDLEKVPETEMCFPSIEEIEKCKDGKTPLLLPPDYLKRIGYRLPTEAEWEYACRAGSQTSRPHGVSNDLLLHYAWDVRNALARTWPVGLKKPNDFGLFDMHGNAAEWCLDLEKPYPSTKDGKRVEDVETVKQITGESRCILRGAPFHPRPTPLRSAYRYWHYPTDCFSTVGLRVARTVR